MVIKKMREKFVCVGDFSLPLLLPSLSPFTFLFPLSLSPFYLSICVSPLYLSIGLSLSFFSPLSLYLFWMEPKFVWCGHRKKILQFSTLNFNLFWVSPQFRREDWSGKLISIITALILLIHNTLCSVCFSLQASLFGSDSVVTFQWIEIWKKVLKASWFSVNFLVSLFFIFCIQQCCNEKFLINWIKENKRKCAIRNKFSIYWMCCGKWDSSSLFELMQGLLNGLLEFLVMNREFEENCQNGGAWYFESKILPCTANFKNSNVNQFVNCSRICGT